MTAYGFIFARGGSKGVPGKNIRPLCGKPLIAHAIEAGLQSGVLEKIIVSTDSEEIAAVARDYGAHTPFLRPAELATDTAPEMLAWQHAVAFLAGRGETFDTFVSLPATAPLRTPDDVRRCVDAFAQGDCDFVITCTKAHHYPPFNMVTLDPRGLASIAMPLDPPPTRRQDVPDFYDVTTVAYVTSAQYAATRLSLWDGRVRAVVVDRVSAIDIDDMMDFDIAELFMKKRLEADHAHR